jgi:hypothetical protein
MKRAIVLACLLPLVASAQFALSTVNGSAETQVGSVLDLGKIAAGDALAVRIRIRNTGTSTVHIKQFSTSGSGFNISAPSVPIPIAPGNLQDVLLNFSASIPSVYGGSLQINSDVNSVSVMVTATVVLGPVLTVFPVCTGSNGPPPSIDFGSVQAGQLRLCNFYLQNPGTQDMTVSTFQVTGSSFQIFSGPSLPFKIAAGTTISFVLTFTPNAVGLYSGGLSIETRSYVLTGAAFAAPLPAPVLQFDSGAIQSAQQRRLTMALPSAASAAASGLVTLAFLPDTTLVADDPAVVFLTTGTRTLPFSISQGSTQISINGQASAMFQTGTTSGRIRFTLTGISTVGDSTTTLTVPATTIALDTATATKRTGELDVQLIGFDNTYSAGAMTFTFFDTSGNALLPGAIHADFTQTFRTFFMTTLAGSAFQVRVSFPVSGDASGIASVDVQLTNSAGVQTQHLLFQ